MDIKIRAAVPDDAADFLSVYGQYIDTEITFEYKLPELSEFRKRIEDVSAFYPYLACEFEGRVIGYAYAHRCFERAAYGWNAELSVYIDKAHLGRGIGKRMYLALMDILFEMGVVNVYGCVTSPNPKSEALHKSLGFSLAGTHHNTGYKNGRWIDVVWFEKRLTPQGEPPKPLIGINELGADRLHEILEKHSACSF